MSIEGDFFKAKQPPNVQPVVGHVVIGVDRCTGKGKPTKDCPCAFCRRG